MEFSSNIEKAEYLFDLFEELNKNDPDALRVVLQQRSGIKLEKFKDLYKLLVEMHNNKEKFKKVKAKSKGTLFEEIIKILTIETKIFSLLENITNDTNEYDIIIKPSKLARNIYNAIPKVVYQPIICECKNYASNVSVTWIGKLYSLLSLSNIKLGIIFSYEGLTGEHSKDNKMECWTDAIGLIRKIFLKEEIAIISIDKYDLEEIINGERFYDVVERKYNELVLATDISKEKIYHPSNEKVQKVIDDINNQVEDLNNLIKQ